ncbi:hypothetical protein [Kitasatospora camelliae]|uniref:Uncharacterized protein n=1 Tax=Kitasatospora camelliae TaxID=3156397 RepID=A0AAU8JPN9_9ACTN
MSEPEPAPERLPDTELMPDEIALVLEYVEIPPGLPMDYADLRKAKLAKAMGGWFRKIGPGLYEIVPHTGRSPRRS